MNCAAAWTPAEGIQRMVFRHVQIVIARNDSEGLRYGAIKTEEKYFLKWKEDETDDSQFKLDKYLVKICRKDRLTLTHARLRAV